MGLHLGWAEPPGDGGALLQIGTIAMKNALFALFFVFCAASAFGQTAGVVTSQASAAAFPEHVQHASQHSMGHEENLFGESPYSYEKGEQPLWEFPSAKRVTPLGDVARAYRKEHETAKKAEIIWEND
jgi:hypothetical protein